MGLVRMGVPTQIALHLRDSFAISTFVETGTYRGDTAKWAAANFDSVVTIEASLLLFQQAQLALSKLSNVKLIKGASRVVLSELVEQLNEPALFWLDAHWCSGDSFGESDQCPLMAELQIIVASEVAHFVLVDDARLFLAPPPRPNDAAAYPSISDLVSVLSVPRPHYITVFEDVLIAVPDAAAAEMRSFMQEQSTQDWNERSQGAKRTALQLPHRLRLLARRWCADRVT